MEVPPPQVTALTFRSTFVNERSMEVWLSNALWDHNKQNGGPLMLEIFCSRFHPILSPLKLILEIVF